MAIEIREPKNKPKPSGGKIILKKINHFTDNKVMDKAYKTTEKINRVKLNTESKVS